MIKKLGLGLFISLVITSCGSSNNQIVPEIHELTINLDAYTPNKGFKISRNDAIAMISSNKIIMIDSEGTGVWQKKLDKGFSNGTDFIPYEDFIRTINAYVIAKAPENRLLTNQYIGVGTKQICGFGCTYRVYVRPIWNRGEIAYSISPNFTDTQKNQIRAIANDWNASFLNNIAAKNRIAMGYVYPKLTEVPQTYTQSALSIFSAARSSYVPDSAYLHPKIGVQVSTTGYDTSYSKNITLYVNSNTNISKATLLYGFARAAGAFNQHNSCYRDYFVTVQDGNTDIPYCDTTFAQDYSIYDFASITQWPYDAIYVGNVRYTPNIEPKLSSPNNLGVERQYAGDKAFRGIRDKLSYYDILGMMNLYNDTPGTTYFVYGPNN